MNDKLMTLEELRYALNTRDWRRDPPGEIDRDLWFDSVDAAIRERDGLRESVTRLNRRAQSAESGVMAAAESSVGGSLGRALANSAATAYKARAEKADAELAALRKRIAEASVVTAKRVLMWPESQSYAWKLAPNVTLPDDADGKVVRLLVEDDDG